MKFYLLPLITLLYACSSSDNADQENTANLDILYAVRSEEPGQTKLVSIDPNNGQEMNLLTLNTTDKFESVSTNKSENTVYVTTSLGDGNTDVELYTIDLNSMTFSQEFISNDPIFSYELVPTNRGVIYSMKQSYIDEQVSTKLISLNPQNGQEIVILDLNTTDNFNSIVFDEQQNILYGVTSLGDGNTDVELYTIDLNSNNYSYSAMGDQFEYELAISNSGILFGIEQTYYSDYDSKLVVINPLNGDIEQIMSLQTTNSFGSMIFYEERLFSLTQLDFPNTDIEVYTIDLEERVFTYQPLNNSQSVWYDLIDL